MFAVLEDDDTDAEKGLVGAEKKISLKILKLMV